MTQTEETAEASPPDFGRMLRALPEKSLEFIVEHFLKYEEKHYLQYFAQRESRDDAHEDDHVFPHLIRLQRWLTRKGADEQWDYFGTCPHCRCHDGYLNIGRQHWYFCQIHRTKWWIGENLLSSWREPSKEEWHENRDYLAEFVDVEPVHVEQFEK